MKRKKIAVKVSTGILITLMVLIVISVFASNLALKNVYDRRDKSDLYWNYNKILEQPYKYLKIDGGNATNIIFEPGKQASVRLMDRWWVDKDSTLKAYVKNDTLHLNFIYKYKNMNEKYWMQSEVLVRLFAPQLLGVEGSNTNFEMQKMKQRNFNISLKGTSRLEVETYDPNFDTLHVTQRDSSQVVFEMSPDLKGSYMMHFNQVTADLTGYTLLDIGRSVADHLKLNMADSSAIILSGKSLRDMEK